MEEAYWEQVSRKEHPQLWEVKDALAEARETIKLRDHHISNVQRDIEAIQDELAEARRQLEEEKAVNQAMKDLLRDPVKSPCGHSSQYAFSEDGGKNIVCLACSHSALAASQTELSEARRQLETVMYHRNELRDLHAKVLHSCVERSEQLAASQQRERELMGALTGLRGAIDGMSLDAEGHPKYSVRQIHIKKALEKTRDALRALPEGKPE